MPNDIDKKILDAVMGVVSREKISGTRMHMIAKEAGMSQASLHYYFPTKKDMMTALLDDIQEEFSNNRKNYIDLENKTAAENIRGFFQQKKDEILSNRDMEVIQFDYWVQGTVNEEIKAKFQNNFSIWRNNISEVLKEGKFTQDIDKEYMEMLPYIIVSLMLGATMQYIIDEDIFNLDEYFDIAEKVLFSNL